MLAICAVSIKFHCHIFPGMGRNPIIFQCSNRDCKLGAASRTLPSADERPGNIYGRKTDPSPAPDCHRAPEKLPKPDLATIQATPVIGASPYYAPDSWLPHITLGIEDVTQSNIGCAVSQLALQSYDWIIPINNLTIVSHQPDQPGEIIRHFRLGNENGVEH